MERTPKIGMQKHITFILFVIISAGIWGCGEKESDNDLKNVDNAIKNSPESQRRALAHADSVSSEALHETDPNRLFEIWLESARQYQPLDLQKSLEFLYKAQEASRFTDSSRTDSIRTLLQLASLFNSEGFMVKEASDIFEDLRDEPMPDNLKTDYFVLGVQLNRTLSDGSFDPKLKKRYGDQLKEYRDSVMKYRGVTGIIAANQLLEQGNFRGALEVMLMEEKNIGTEERKGPWYHYVSRLYQQMEMPDSQRYYLSLAAIDDLNHGVTDYKALTDLAALIASTDIDRAHTYIEKSSQDSKLSHSKKQQTEIAPVLEHIQHSYSNRQKQRVAIISLVSGGLLVVLITIVMVSVTLKKKNNVLKAQSRALAEANEKELISNRNLESVNMMLAEEGRVKSHYIHSFMELCLSYLSKMESYRARLGKIATEGDLKKVVKAINSSRYVQQEIAEFYESFDKAFLTLYPDFFKKLNELLREEERYEPGEKLSTELRVYSLIWLGIDGSGEIAKFLRCSESTVYNYRTIMRNKAIEREAFEREFKQMGSSMHLQK